VTPPGPAAPLIGQRHRRSRRRQGAQWLLGGLPPLLALLTIWAAARDRLTSTTYDAANGVVGELVAGRHVGQTFVAAHAGLSAIDLQLATYARANPGSVVLHLRRRVTGPDVRTVSVPAAALADNAWHRFAFPPLADSYRQAYYLDLEQPGATTGHTITAYWNSGRGDPYPYGQAISDGQPTDGDLAFGLVYSPPPGALWADLWTTLRAALPAGLSVGLVVAGLACVGLLGALLWGAAHDWFSGRRRRTARLGALLGLFALAHGTVWLIAVPPWQGPDEFSHYAVVALIAAGVSPDDSSAAATAVRARLEKQILAAMDARQFTRMVSWYSPPGGPATGFVTRSIYGGSTMFAQVRQPSLYYRLAALPLRLAAADPTAIPPDVGLWLVRGVSVVGNSLIVLLAWGCALLVAPGPRLRLLWLALPLTVALLPMRAFIDSMANNDVLAELAVSLVVLLLFAWFTAPPSAVRRKSALAVAALVASGLSLATKSTALFAVAVLWPIAVLGAIVLVLTQLTGRWGPIMRWLGAGVALVAALGLAGMVGTSFDAQGTAQVWLLSAGLHAPHAVSTTAHSGRYVLALPARATAYQQIDLPDAHPVYTVTLQTWARAATAAGGQVTASFRVGGSGVPVTPTVGTLLFPSATAPTWQLVTATVQVPSDATFLRPLLTAGAAPVAVDDAAWQVTAGPDLPPPPATLALHNSAFEDTALQLRPDAAFAHWLGRAPSDLNLPALVDMLTNRQAFDKEALTQSFAGNAYRSYIGWFGWVVLPLQLPSAQYAGGLLVIGLALAGWPLAWLRPRLALPLRVLGAVCAIGLTVIVGLTILRQLTVWAQVSLREFPQGRYFFVLMIPAVWWLLTGLGQWLTLPARLRGGQTAITVRASAAWLGLVLLLYLDLYALFVLILPYYYGRF